MLLIKISAFEKKILKNSNASGYTPDQLSQNFWGGTQASGFFKAPLLSPATTFWATSQACATSYQETLAVAVVIPD